MTHPPDDYKPEFELFQQIMETVRNELLDEAFTGNIHRRHHFESALDSMEMVQITYQCEDIVKAILLPDLQGD